MPDFVFNSIIIMQLLIKNMVCDRCVRVVQEEFEKLGLVVKSVDLGYVELASTPTDFQIKQIQEILHKSGFEHIQNTQIALVEQIKRLIINEIHYSKNDKKSNQNFSNFLSEKLQHDYSFLSTLFSSIEHITIEKYIISQKIERAKELIFNGELSISEIAWSLEYSSVAHLSNQFKQLVGKTPSAFKQQDYKNRKSLDVINNYVNH